MKFLIYVSIVVLVTINSKTYVECSLWSSNNNYSLLCDTQEVSLGCKCPVDESEFCLNCNQKEIQNIPTGISFPDRVTHATFKDNVIESIVNRVFYSGRGLLGLDLSFNKIKFVSNDAFGNLENLQSLDLSHNEIWNLPVSALSSLSNLITLDLSYNKISTFFPEVFKPCIALRDLRFRYNPMLFVEKDSFNCLSALEKLDIESTGLSNLPYNVFKNNTVLHTLSLSSNSLATVPINGLLSAASLKELDISENPIEEFDAESFKGLETMEVLTATHMRKLRKIQSGAFHGLPSLRELYMADNLELTSISETAFARLFSLGELFESRSLLKAVFRHCGLTTLPKHVLRWDEMVELDLSENPWNCDCHMDWIADSKLNMRSKKTMVCANPPHLGGKSVAGLGKTDFTCRLLSIEAIIGLALLVSMSFMMALTAAAFFLYRKRICLCLKRRRETHKYMRVITRKEKVDLEWDNEPFAKSSEA